MSIRVGAALVFGLVLALGPVVARTDMFPEEELYGFEIAGDVEITGLSRFPEHVFYAFPLRCTRALVGLEEGGIALGNEDLKVEDGKDDQANFAVLQDGPLEAWIGGGNPCQQTRLFALGREVAAGIDLAAMPLATLQTFFAEDSRLFRSDFVFLGNPPYANTGSPLRGVAEVVRVLRIEPDALKVVLDETTYRFEDGTEQTVKLGHTKRPPELPFRALKPAKVEKYASSYAKWEARQPVELPPAPKLPEGAEEETETGGSAGETGGSAGETGVVATPVVATPVVATPVVATPVVVAAVPEAAVPEAVVEGEEDEVVEAAEARPFLRRAWPLGIAVVVGVGAAIALRRRPGG